MNKYFVLLVLDVILSSCTENKPDFPKEFEYSSSTFEGEILTYNSTGKLLNSSTRFFQKDFLFSKEFGIYPIDKIVLNQKNAAQFFVSDSKMSFVLEGDYLISNNKIMLDMYFKNTNNDTLKLSADYNSNKFTIEAYGFKIYGPNVDNDGTQISSAGDFGLVDVSKLLRYAKPTDTICVQQFYESYILK